MRRQDIDKDRSQSGSVSPFGLPRKRILLRRVVLGIAIAGAAVFYFLYNPGERGFFPRCPFLMVTGWECPGCGSQRAIHYLLHGHVAEAWRMNPLLVALLPYLFAGLIVEILYRLQSRKRMQPANSTEADCQVVQPTACECAQPTTTRDKTINLQKNAGPQQYGWVAWARKNLYGATAAWVIIAVVVVFTVLRNIFDF